MKLGLLFLFASIACSSVSAITVSDVVTLANQDGSVTISNDSIIVTPGSNNKAEEAIFSDNSITLMDQDGSIIITEDSVTVADTAGEAVFTDEFITLAHKNGFITVNEDTVTFADIMGEHVFTDDSVTLANKNGAVTITEDSITVTDIKGEAVFTDDSVTLANNYGIVTFTENSITFTDTKGDTTILQEASSDGLFEVISANADGNYIAEQVGKCRSISELICLGEDFSYLCDMITAYDDVLEAVTNNEEWTLFAPTDSAFDAISGDIDIQNLPEDDLIRLILFHGTNGVVEADDLECGELVEMLDAGWTRTRCETNSDGEDIVVQKGGGNIDNNILPGIVQANAVACNGVIHVIDHVMLPNFITAFNEFD